MTNFSLSGNVLQTELLFGHVWFCRNVTTGTSLKNFNRGHVLFAKILISLIDQCLLYNRQPPSVLGIEE